MRAVLHLPDLSENATGAAEARTLFALLQQGLESAGVTLLSPRRRESRAPRGQRHASGLQGSAAVTPDIWLTVGWTRADSPPVAEQEAAGIPWALVVPEAFRPDDLTENASDINRAVAVVVVGSGGAHAIAPLTVATRIVQLAPFIDTAPFTAAFSVRDQHKAAIASRLQLPLASPWLLVLAPPKREATHESFTMLARACSRLAMLDWRLLVAGEDESLDEMRALLRPLAEQRLRFWPSLTLQDRVRLCVSCNFLLWPALRDMGLEGLLEAQAAGIPVVACSSERVRERVQDGVTGRLAKVDNAESLANHAAFFLRHPAFVRSCGEQARKMALNEHDVRFQGERLRHGLARVVEAGAQ